MATRWWKKFDDSLMIVTPVTHLPGRAHLRSAKNGDYDIPRVLSGFGQRSFSVSGPDACAL